jgi:hypothetical protein
MATKPVARDGDVSASVGSLLPPGVAEGTWQDGPVSVTKKPSFTSDGTALVVAASCTFTMPDAKAPNGNPVAVPPSIVNLNPESRKLKVGGSSPLVDGDFDDDNYGNTVSVSSSAAWSTS